MPTQLIRKQFLLTERENKLLEEEAKKKGLSVSNLTRLKHGLPLLEQGRKTDEKKAPRGKLKTA